MSFRSEAHRKKIQELVKQGKVKQSEYDRMHAATPFGIPERVEQPKKQKSLLRRKHR